MIIDLTIFHLCDISLKHEIVIYTTLTYCDDCYFISIFRFEIQINISAFSAVSFTSAIMYCEVVNCTT